MADQLRHDWLGCAGSAFASTPNIDGLAERGVHFSQCITPAAICAPARISLATGMLPHRLGTLTNRDYLPARTATYYQRLRDYGYQVGCVGKLDLAKGDRYNGTAGDRPRAFGWGFTHPVEVEGKSHAGISPTPLGPYGHWLQGQGLLAQLHHDYTVTRKQPPWITHIGADSVLPAAAHADRWIADRSSQWLEERTGEFPWHLLVSFVGPHDPFDPPAEYAALQRDSNVPAAISDSRAGKPEWLAEFAKAGTSDQVAHLRRQYSAVVALIDDGVGSILEVLERRGWRENTVIVFTSDHGDMLGDHGLFGKHTAYEASVRVPLIVAGPGVAANGHSAALVELQDVGAALCDLAGVPALERTDARSFAPLLRGHGNSGEAHRDAAVTQTHNFRALRSRHWKYIDNINAAPELYDLENDPDELTDLASTRPEVVGELAQELRQRLAEGAHLH